MSATDDALTALFNKIAKKTGKSVDELRREFDKDRAAFGDKYYQHMTPQEMALFS